MLGLFGRKSKEAGFTPREAVSTVETATFRKSSVYLSPAHVKTVRNRLQNGASVETLVSDFKVSKSTIYRIQRQTHRGVAEKAQKTSPPLELSGVAITLTTEEVQAFKALMNRIEGQR